MPSHEVILDQDDDDGWIHLRTISPSGLTDQHLLALPAGFGSADVEEALVATGLVERQDAVLFMTRWTSARELADLAEGMLAYFWRSGVPRESLLNIKVRADDFLHDKEIVNSLSLWSYAWADLMLREDLADSARSAADIWSDAALVVDLAAHRLERLRELAARQSPAEHLAGDRRIAPSSRERRAPGDEKFKTG